ncbi:hypothetical protein C4580_02805 [Candidatus Woesearchaeota archaeon]|nr:MAG: hypothetical protein C4580_02805 [Candidatus Woesearchaeota archaeon]
MENVLLTFLLTLIILFFIPKIVYRLYRIPFPITEILLGILLGIFLPDVFRWDDTLSIIGTIGIITLFVHSGMEIDGKFIARNRRFFIENFARHILVLCIIAAAVGYFYQTGIVVSFIAALGFTAPSASYIFSGIRGQSGAVKNWIAGKAIAGEIMAIFLLLIFLKINKLTELAVSLAVVGLLITVLPHVLHQLYHRIFSTIVGNEFSFIFVVAVVSAFITELLGIHFLVGAFLAGVVSRRFVRHIVKSPDYKHVTVETGQQIIEGFSFFAILFAPFYFFSIGLQIADANLPFRAIAFSSLLGIAILLVRAASMYFHRHRRFNEPARKSFTIVVSVLPTLFFSFVIAEILHSVFSVEPILYESLLVYGLLSTLLSFAVQQVFGTDRKAAH